MSAWPPPNASIISSTSVAQPGDQLSERAHQLLDEGRVLVSERQALIVGVGGLLWIVTAFPDGVRCSCPARESETLCSHVVAAMVAWGEAGG